MDIVGSLERWLARRGEGVRDRKRSETERRSGSTLTGAAASSAAATGGSLLGLSLDDGRANGPVPGSDFALELYGRLRERPGNLCFSPLSIRVALAVACEGARGETAAQMRRVLGLPAEGPLALGAIGALQAKLGASGVLSVASAVWTKQGQTLLQSYLDALSGAVDCGVGQLDFEGNPEAAAECINDWTRRQTHGRIGHVVSADSFNALTRLVLVTAVFFQGQWRTPFDPDRTRDEAFHLADGGTVRVPLMRERLYARYFEAERLQGLELAYDKTSLSLLLLLPSSPTDLPALEAELSPDVLESWLRTAFTREVDVLLPRFRLSADVDDLVAQCAALGMPRPFTRAADFSGINGCSPPDREALYIGAVCHRATIEVDEQGTTAAAATAVMMLALSAERPAKPPRIPEFRADRPFLFAIRDSGTGTLVFLGRVVDPTT